MQLKQTYQRVISFTVLVVLMVLAACSGGGGSNPPDNSSGNGGGQPNSSSPSSEGGEKAAIRMMANFSTANIEASDKAFFDKLQEAVNVDLQFIVPPASGYQEQLQLTLVSGDYPDIIFFPNENNEAYLNAVNDGILIPLNEYLENAPSLKDYTYDVSWDALKTKRDGDIYGIPRTTIARYDGFEVRKDWLDNIGFEIPDNHEVTIDQFTDILRKFTFEDPDGNGKDDTYGFSAFLNGDKVLGNILSAQLGNMGWQEASGGEYQYMSPIYDQNSTVYKDILAYTQQLYKEGLLDPDAAVIDSNVAHERFKRGITGVRPEFAGWVPTGEEEMKLINPDAELTYLFVQDRQGELKGVMSGTGIWGLWGVTNKAKNPQKAVEILDWMLSDEGWEYVRFGVEGVDFQMVDGKRQYDPDVKSNWRTAVVRRAGDGDFFIPPTLEQDKVDLIKPWIDKAVNSVSFTLDRGFVPPVARQPELMDFKLTWNETITKINVGELPVDEFDNLLAQWYEKGGRQYVEQMNEYIASYR